MHCFERVSSCQNPAKERRQMMFTSVHKCIQHFHCSDAESSHTDEEDFDTEAREDMGDDEEKKSAEDNMNDKTGWDSAASSQSETGTKKVSKVVKPKPKKKKTQECTVVSPVCELESQLSEFLKRDEDPLLKADQ